MRIFAPDLDPFVRAVLLGAALGPIVGCGAGEPELVSASTAPFRMEDLGLISSIPDHWTLRREDTFDSRGGRLALADQAVLEIRMDTGARSLTPPDRGDVRLLWSIVHAEAPAYTVVYNSSSSMLRIACDLSMLSEEVGVLLLHAGELDNDGIQGILSQVLPRRLELFRRLLSARE